MGRRWGKWRRRHTEGVEAGHGRETYNVVVAGGVERGEEDGDKGEGGGETSESLDVR